MVESERVLAGKTALVTGAGRGLGRAFAERLAAAGCAVGLHGMREHGPAEYGEGTTLTDTAGEVGQQFGVETISVLGDLTANSDVQRVVTTVTRELGPIDILVHSAGIAELEPADEVTWEVWERTFAVNVHGTFHMIYAVKDEMIERGYGRIVTLSSIAGLRTLATIL